MTLAYTTRRPTLRPAEDSLRDRFLELVETRRPALVVHLLLLLVCKPTVRHRHLCFVADRLELHRDERFRAPRVAVLPLPRDNKLRGRLDSLERAAQRMHLAIRTFHREVVRATFARIELVNLIGKPLRSVPFCNQLRIDPCPKDIFGLRVERTRND